MTVPVRVDDFRRFSGYNATQAGRFQSRGRRRRVRARMCHGQTTKDLDRTARAGNWAGAASAGLGRGHHASRRPAERNSDPGWHGETPASPRRLRRSRPGQPPPLLPPWQLSPPRHLYPPR